VKDSAPPELDWLLSCNIDELIASVHPMSAKICEQYARAILGRIGGPSYDQLLIRLIETMIPRDGRGPPNNSDEYYFAIRDLFPHVAAENDVLGRLCVSNYADVPTTVRKTSQFRRELKKCFDEA